MYNYLAIEGINNESRDFIVINFFVIQICVKIICMDGLINDEYLQKKY